MSSVCITTLNRALEFIGDLSPELTAKTTSFGVKRRQSYLAGRALLQRFMGHLGLITGSLPKIAPQISGKPYFVDFPDLGFNISHSADFVAVCVGSGEQGIDLECVRTRKNQAGLEQRLLSPSEIHWLDCLGAERRSEGFIELWTLRECLVKLSGKGLAGLDSLKVWPDKRSLSCQGCPAGAVYSFNTKNLLSSTKIACGAVFSSCGEPSCFVLLEDGFKPITPSDLERFELWAIE